MNFLRNVALNRFQQTINFSTKPIRKPKSVYKLNEQVNKDLESGVYKPKYHPGRLKLKTVELPKKFVSGLQNATKDFPTKQLINDGHAINRYLKARHVPLEHDAVRFQRKKCEKEVLERFGAENMEQVEVEGTARDQHEVRKQVAKLFFSRNYQWKPMAFDDYKSLAYAYGRSALEYSVVLRVLQEIADRDSNFKPSSFFDFGAGVGTGTWAASEIWKNSIFEYFSVDSSGEMNDLAELILREGDMNKNMTLKNVYYRQFLPASTEISYHLVLSAFSLMELPDMKKRLETLQTLWNKCDGYMVLIEEGTNAGFNLIREARDFLVTESNNKDSIHIFAPCPHHEICPKGGERTDGSPCNFESKYKSLAIGEPQPDRVTYFSYLILKKGPRPSPLEDPSIDWPRVVRTVMVRRKHTICRMCTHRGKLEECIFTRSKHSTMLYRATRKSTWGDRLPVTITDDDNSTEETDSENGDAVEDQNAVIEK